MRSAAWSLAQPTSNGTLNSADEVWARSIAEMLERTLGTYQSRAIEAVQVIEELIAPARGMRAAADRGVALGLTEDELAL